MSPGVPSLATEEKANGHSGKSVSGIEGVAQVSANAGYRSERDLVPFAPYLRACADCRRPGFQDVRHESTAHHAATELGKGERCR